MADYVNKLGTQLRGELITASSAEYDSARRIWNGMIDKHPAAIARCVGVSDIQACVRFAAEHDVALAVRGGGHNVAGTALVDGGLVIDLTRMRGGFVDPVKRTIRAQGGMTWGDFDRETQVYGLAATGGLISTTGIAGLTLGGGYGWLMGRYGLACDNVRSYQVVTADGEVRTASTEEHSDLNWALHGGGGNFGVVASMEYQLYPLRTVLGGMLLYPLKQGSEVLRFYRDFVRTIPEELILYAGAITTPDGFQALALIGCYCGEDMNEGARVLEPLKQFTTPVADMMGPMPYLALQSMLDAGAPYGIHSYWKSGFLPELPDDAIDTFIDFTLRATSPQTLSIIEYCHGAVTRVAADATAIPLRSNSFDLVILSLWPEGPPEAHVRWTRDFWGAMHRYSGGAVYVNGLSADDGGRVRDSYGHNYARLVEVKEKYDPSNLFRSNQNIRRAASAGA